MLDPKKWSKQPGGTTELQKSAVKALRMKEDAGAPTTTPGAMSSSVLAAKVSDAW